MDAIATEQQQICGSCNTSSVIREIPGQYRDFDADWELHGTVGIPLCSECLGTGRSIDTAEFLTLRREVSQIRKENFRIQLKAKEDKDWAQKVQENNQRLIEISQKALKMISQPAENCLAEKLSPKNV